MELKRIGVMSDTHLRAPNKRLDHILDSIFKDTHMILHAGDIVGHRTLERLEERGVIAVCGNMDDYEVASTIPQTRIIPVGNIKIGLVHGWGAKQGLEMRIVERFSEQSPEIIVYGHSHRPFWGEVEGVWLFNPGSAAPGAHGNGGTVGELQIDGSDFKAEILDLD